jgi:hypothetical protein
MRWRKKTTDLSRSRRSLFGARIKGPKSMTQSSGSTPIPSIGEAEREAPISEATTQTERRSNDGEFYADFIEKELVDQRASKASLEQRGLAVVSTSGVLVAVLFGFTTIARDGRALDIPASARLWFYVALGAFAVAAAFALAVMIPRGYDATNAVALADVLRDRWQNPPWMARRRVAATRLKIYASYRRGNRRKGILLALAIACEVCAVFLLAVAIALVIADT